MNRFLATVLVIVALAGATLWHAHAVLHQTLALDADALPLEIRTGETLQGVAARLHQAGIIDAPERLVWFARLSGRDLEIKVGEYEMQLGMRASELIDMLVAGRTVLHAMTVVEGWTYTQLRRELARHPAIVQTLEGVDDDELMAQLGKPGVHPEGWFFPDTYLFAKGTTDVAFLERAMRTMDAHLAQAWESRDGGLPYETPYEALVMASIIEREARVIT